jgi:hypothetical protein
MELLGRGTERTNREVMGVCAIAGAMGLCLFGRSVWNEGNGHAASSGSAVHWKVQTVYAPKALIEFARENPEISNHVELLRLIRKERLNVWYAVVLVDGVFAKMRIAYRLGDEPDRFRNEKTVLLRLAGRPPGSGYWDYAEAEVVVIEDAFMDMEPVEGLMSLLGR